MKIYKSTLARGNNKFSTYQVVNGLVMVSNPAKDNGKMVRSMYKVLDFSQLITSGHMVEVQEVKV